MLSSGMDGAGISMFVKISRRIKAKCRLKLVFSALSPTCFDAMMQEGLVGNSPGSHTHFNTRNEAVEHVEQSLLTWASQIQSLWFFADSFKRSVVFCSYARRNHVRKSFRDVVKHVFHIRLL